MLFQTVICHVFMLLFSVMLQFYLLRIEPGQHLREIHVAGIIEFCITGLVITVILPCDARAVHGVMHQGKQLVMRDLQAGINTDGAAVLSAQQKFLPEIPENIRYQTRIPLGAVVGQRSLRL